MSSGKIIAEILDASQKISILRMYNEGNEKGDTLLGIEFVLDGDGPKFTCNFQEIRKGNAEPSSTEVAEEQKRNEVLSKREEVECYTCPITQGIMVDPVICPEGHSFERIAIEAWLEDHNTNPVTRTRLTKAMLVPNRELKRIIIIRGKCT